jgi:hypothetical protein
MGMGQTNSLRHSPYNMPSSTVDNIAALSSGMPFAKAMAKMSMKPWRCTRVRNFASPVSNPVYIVIFNRT